MRSHVLIAGGLLAGMACQVLALGSRTPPATGRGRAERAVHHYVFFGREREKLRGSAAFLETPALEGAQVAYSWRELEPRKDAYDFSAIREDLAFLTSRRKKLFVQLQDVSFSLKQINVPNYLLREKPVLMAEPTENITMRAERAHPTVVGWMARRWTPRYSSASASSSRRWGKRSMAGSKGSTSAETAVDVVERGPLRPQGFSDEIYRDAIITNMQALKAAFPRSVTIDSTPTSCPANGVRRRTKAISAPSTRPPEP